ncbi:MAG: hypothetical protein RLZZ383_3059 [Pseudomonadota bacterium]|jgi:hypothetical protein
MRRGWTRRGVLASVGAAAGLPWLAKWGAAEAEDTALAGANLMFVYVPNGVWIQDWALGTLSLDTLSPLLSPLAPWRDEMLVVRGLRHAPLAFRYDNPHANLAPSILTGEDLSSRAPVGATGGRSVDQVAADAWGEDALVLCAEEQGPCLPSKVADRDECTFYGHISWRGRETPVLPETDPAGVRSRLFGLDVVPAGVPADLFLQRQVAAADAVALRTEKVLPSLPSADRPRVAAWVDALQRAAAASEKVEAPCSIGAWPVSDDPFSPGRRVDELGIVAALALASGTSRVVNLSLGRENSRRVFPQFGLGLDHHTLSHWDVDPSFVEPYRAICRWEMDKVASILRTLDATPTCDGGRLLDRTIVVVLAGMSDPMVHAEYDLPVAVVGGRGLGVRGDRVLDVPDASIGRLHLALLEQVGVVMPSFGADATTPLRLG